MNSFSNDVMVFRWGRLCPPGDIQQRLETFLAAELAGARGCCWHPAGTSQGHTEPPQPSHPAPRVLCRGREPGPVAAAAGKKGGRGGDVYRLCCSVASSPAPVCLTDLRKGKQPIVGPDGSAPAGAINPHRHRVLPFAVDGGRWKPARHISLQRVLAVLAALFSPRAVPESEHL